jgi:hypothetical protein
MQVDSMNKNGILLEVLQVLSDLDLHIFKAYITSDGGWFMDGKIYYSLYSTMCCCNSYSSTGVIPCVAT